MTIDLKYWADIGQVVSGIGGFISALGVLVAVWQIMLLQKQATTSFEDKLVDDYRRIVAELPAGALLGHALGEAELLVSLPAFYRYFDLCNQQIYLHRQKRVTQSTWALWKDGIQSNLSRPGFARAWEEIDARVKNDFNELRALCPPQKTMHAVASGAVA